MKNIEPVPEQPVMDEIEKNVLSHMGNYTEEPFEIIES